MLTLRQIERHCQAQAYPKLIAELSLARPESMAIGELTGSPAVIAAALAVIRLDELQQSHAPLCSQLLRRVLAAQESDGGWGEPMTTALCLRALSTRNGAGLAIHNGFQYLANLQQPEGLWPRIPIRRLPADALVSAFILFELSDLPEFRATVHFADAVAWFEKNPDRLDAVCQSLWNRTHLRWRLYAPEPAPALASWS